jgi:hypothetical protein
MRKFDDFVDTEFMLRRDFLSTHPVVLRNRIDFCRVSSRSRSKAIGGRGPLPSRALSKMECAHRNERCA